MWLSETTGDRLTQDGLKLVLRRIGRRANVAHCHAHSFRRTCALWSLHSGMNIYALQQLMGHYPAKFGAQTAAGAPDYVTAWQVPTATG